MAQRIRHHLPGEATKWMLDSQHSTVMTIDLPCSLAENFARHARRVYAIASSQDQARTYEAASDNIIIFCAQADALPVQPCSVHTIVLPSHFYTSLDQSQVLRQLSRALHPDGWVCSWHINRDDSVPWVRRLQNLMHTVDPTSMSSQSSPETIVSSSKYFPHYQQRSFRLWVPVNPQFLLGQIQAKPAFQALDASRQASILDQAHSIFSHSAGLSELRLPYQLNCWKAKVDHAELTQPIVFPDGGLIIPI